MLWSVEWRLLRRSRFTLAAVALLTLLASIAVASGLMAVGRQSAAIERVRALAEAEQAEVARWAAPGGDAGTAAYYSLQATWDPPAPLAFAAIGFRDVVPYTLRVRALGLEAQLYESEQVNPELALAGRFDFAFVLVYLAPLFVIALFHDMISGEREAGRLRTLQALPAGGGALWRRRAALRLALLWGALTLPFIAGAVIAGAPFGGTLAILAVTMAYLLFWVAVAALVDRWRNGSVANAATLAACWLILTLVLPAGALVAINAAVPVRQGVELTLAQREAVHGAWERPRSETMQRFLAANPRWSNTAPIGEAFHYKWYFAFHENADRSVAPQAAAYRAGLIARDRAAHLLGTVVPPVGVQLLLARLAGTDVDAQLAYQQRIRDYHRRLRHYFYDYLFADRRFDADDYAAIPRYRPGP